MATSSILGGDRVPAAPSGTDMASLGPSDLSDSGSDSLGAHSLDELEGDSDSGGTGERASVEPDPGISGADILPDHLEKVADAEPMQGVEETTPDGSPDDDWNAEAAEQDADAEIPLEDRPDLIDTSADVRALAVEEPGLESDAGLVDEDEA